MSGLEDLDEAGCGIIVQLADAILSCFNGEEDNKPPIRRSEEVGTEFYKASHAVPTNTESESEDEVYKHLKAASELKKTTSFKNDQVPSTSRASVPEISCHVVREIVCAEVVPRNKAIVQQPRSRAATAVALDQVTDTSKGAIPKRVTEEKGKGKGKGKGKTTKPVSQVKKADSQVTAEQNTQEASRVVAAQVEPQPCSSRPKTVEPKPRLYYQQSDSQVTAEQNTQEASRVVAAQVEPQPRSSRPKTAEPKSRLYYQQSDSQVTAEQNTQEASRAVAAQEEPQPGSSRPKTVEPKLRLYYQQSDSQVTAEQNTQETSRAKSAQVATQPCSSRPKTVEPKPRLYYQQSDSQVTAEQNIQEPSRAVAAQEEPQPGSSRPKTAEPKVRLYYQQSDCQVTAGNTQEASRAVAAKTAEPKPRLYYPQTSVIQTDEFQPDDKPAPSVQKITPANCPARAVFRILATAFFSPPGKHYSCTPLKNWVDKHIDDLYHKFLDESNGALNDPPSPAPFDPNDLKQVYGDRFEGFIPFYSQRDPRTVDFIGEQHQPKSSTIRSFLLRHRRVSLPNIESRYPPSEYTENILSDVYGRAERHHWLARPRSNSESAETYCRRLYEKQHHRPRVYETRTIWSPDPQVNISDDELIQEDVLNYRRRSSQTFLRLSPEFPEDPKYFKETLYHRRPRLSASPLRQAEDSYVEESVVEDSDVDTSRQHRSSDRRRKKMGRMNTVDERERTIIIEFCHLLEKSKQLFNGLRELPQYGHKQWHAYFAKTFDVYSKLWKFQQQHRAILDSKYGLKRWQIGEIASKIGQLYYHFYLRTSDTGYLNEAFSFYYAIRGRCYYTQACREDKCELMVKKLRYYARFIVASLLLKKTKLVKDLLKELDRQIIEYGNAYEPDDQNEWRIVADEVRSFIKVETVVEVVHTREFTCFLSHRLGAPISPPTASALDRASSPLALTLREALIIGSNSTQLKFSELTMDMYRIMQTLEREPNTDVNHLYDESPRQRNPPTPSAINNKGYNADSTNNTGEAPHKQMLFKPSPNQIFLYLSSAIDDLPPNGVVLLYISAEGLIIPNSKHQEEAGGYDMGGLITTSKTDVLTSSSKDAKGLAPKLKEAPVLHPGDLYPFTRRPMFIIVDSDNSFIFNSLPRIFGQPLIILMSPIELPATLYPHNDDQRKEGSLFTLFLHDPLSAVCLCCDIKRMQLEDWQRSQATIDSFLTEAGILLARTRENTYVQFLGDDFLRLLILRFIFCETILRMHRMFRGRAQRTRCSPSLPDDLFEHPILTRIVMDLAALLQIRGHFHDPAAVQRE